MACDRVDVRVSLEVMKMGLTRGSAPFSRDIFTALEFADEMIRGSRRS